MRVLNGRELKPMINASLSWLRQHQESINALNVFPVPDGDTGTNMALTMKSAWEEVVETEEPHVGRFMQQLSHGALMGARGNSGVILSQILRGLAYGIDGHGNLTVDLMARSLRVAADTAYKGVVKPVEGTILTVIREVADYSEAYNEETPQDEADLLALFEGMVDQARVSVDRTPNLLPVLKQAGVVDSGGQGLYVIFEGMLRQMKGLPVDDLGAYEPELSQAGLDFGPDFDPHEATGGLHFDSDYPYDVQFIIAGQQMDVDAIRADIELMGDCPLTVGDSDLIKVHVHVADPGEPISYGASRGSLRDVVVEDMQAQYETYVASRQGAQLTPNTPIAFGDQTPPKISVIVVASGEGLTNVFRSLGATAVVQGGQTMNPSTAQLLEAVESAVSDDVLILPNNKNILMAAEQAAEVSQKQVKVVPTRTIPQGVSAMLALDQDASLEQNVEAMMSYAGDVITGEITWATRDVHFNGVRVQEGDAIGLLEDELVVSARSLGEAVRWLLAEVDLKKCELVTLYYGDQVDVSEADQLVEELMKEYPELEFEVVEGNQPHYPYILSAE
jgi:DAK2 domain fusion protein YloV